MAGGIVGSIVGGLVAPLAPAINALVPGVIDIIKRYVPDPEKQAEIQNELTKRLLDAESEENKIMLEVAQSQLAINLAETQKGGLVNNWRPAAAWACVVGLWYSFLFQPLLGWVTTMAGASIGAAIPSPPVLNVEVIMGLLTGLLGLGTLKTYERATGAAAPDPGSPKHVEAIARAVRR